MHAFRKTIMVVVILACSTTILLAQSVSLEGRGTLLSINGDCEYDQTEERRVLSFMGGLTGTVWIMDFEEPECRPEAPDSPYIDAAAFDQKQIAHKIARILKRGGVVHADTIYETEQLYSPGVMLSEGVCMIDKKYPAAAVAIHFVTDDNHRIAQVEYIMAYGCGDAIQTGE